MSSSKNPDRRVIAGNWKMYKTRREGVALVEELLDGLPHLPAGSELLVFPSFIALGAVADRCAGTPIAVGGQNLHPGSEGAFTGEISARMLLEAGATHVLIGHSERRQCFGEGDELLARKVRFARDSGLTPVFCLGETLQERDGGQTETVLERQLREGLGELSGEEVPGILVAYEPVWAIGTGRTATPEQAREAHAFLRGEMVGRWGELARSVPLLYGGSVKPDNATELLSQPDVDGVLVGGASLDPVSFLGIASAGR
jgi:triosephosphate isomerase (TIM)